RPGANAISVARDVLRKIETLQGTVIPREVEVAITRHYGNTAAEKSNELLLHMGLAVVGVSLLILLPLGWRESAIVAVAIPATLALTLLVFYLSGFTLNRITLICLPPAAARGAPSRWKPSAKSAIPPSWPRSRSSPRCCRWRSWAG